MVTCCQGIVAMENKPMVYLVLGLVVVCLALGGVLYYYKRQVDSLNLGITSRDVTIRLSKITSEVENAKRSYEKDHAEYERTCAKHAKLLAKLGIVPGSGYHSSGSEANN